MLFGFLTPNKNIWLSNRSTFMLFYKGVMHTKLRVDIYFRNGTDNIIGV
jgi:hypothetical protein